ncbi:SCO2322 family protein [Streptomyces sp. 549]|uniref:SCO2322 family protein n=1 Tax=Streptomyces sp. 549 TaxID=3049076 RepID=UPI0024C33CBE|nr:SCO2322 family protein [Streptomyces sp. 549]MDK1474007.1 SCO2322 family protein [Streptomyces sp. 549]
MRGRAGLPARLRIAVTAALAAATAAALLLLGAPAAQAEGYRYWSFWTSGSGGEWTYATQGPGTLRPADGQVVGFRFAVSADSADAARPRQDPDFAGLCADAPAPADGKRVAVVVDPGTAGDAPGGESPPKPRSGCASLDSDGTAADALAAVAKPLRYNSDALLCGIAGYPAAGCGERVGSDPSPDAGETTPAPDADARDGGQGSDGRDGQEDSGGGVLPLVAGVVTVAVLAGGAMWQARRRRE